MINRLREIRSAAFISAGVAIVAFIFLFNSAPAAAEPVQYVKICSLYGAAFLYIPGTDTCLNVETDDAREESPGGVWRWQIPDSQWRWINSTPRNACGNGKLVKLGTVTPSDLIYNTHERFEIANPVPLNLKKKQYVASVFYRGGFYSTEYQVADLPACPSSNTTVTDATDSTCTAGTTPAGGGGGRCEVECVNGAWQFTGNVGLKPSVDNVCTFYYYVDSTDGPSYSFPLGCVDTAPLANLSGTIQFTANLPLPPATTSQVYITLANGYQPGGDAPSSIQGQMKVWLCLRK